MFNQKKRLPKIKLEFQEIGRGDGLHSSYLVKHPFDSEKVHTGRIDYLGEHRIYTFQPGATSIFNNRYGNITFGEETLNEIVKFMKQLRKGAKDA